MSSSHLKTLIFSKIYVTNLKCSYFLFCKIYCSKGELMCCWPLTSFSLLLLQFCCTITQGNVQPAQLHWSPWETIDNVQMSSTVFALSYICCWGKLGSSRGNSKEPWRYLQAGVLWERPIETSVFRMLSAVRRDTHMHSSSGNCKIWKKD